MERKIVRHPSGYATLSLMIFNITFFSFLTPCGTSTSNARLFLSLQIIFIFLFSASVYFHIIQNLSLQIFPFISMSNKKEERFFFSFPFCHSFIIKFQISFARQALLTSVFIVSDKGTISFSSHILQ